MNYSTCTWVTLDERTRSADRVSVLAENLSKIGSAPATALIARYANLWVGLNCVREGEEHRKEPNRAVSVKLQQRDGTGALEGQSCPSGFTKTGKLDPLLRRPVGELITGPCPRPAGPRTWPLETRIVHGSRPPGHLHEPCPCPHSGRASLCAPACAACRPWNMRPRHWPLSSISAPLLCRLAPFPQTVSRIITITYHITPAPPPLQK